MMDTYNGIVFGMSDPTTGQGRYDRAPERLATPPAGGGTTVEVTATGLIGPWLPSVGVPYHWTFTGTDAEQLAAGLHFQPLGAGCAEHSDDRRRQLHPLDGRCTDTVRQPARWRGDPAPERDTGQQSARWGGGVGSGGDRRRGYPAGSGQSYRALPHQERVLRRRDESPDARPGHHADRLARMLAAEEMVGDDEQYAGDADGVDAAQPRPTGPGGDGCLPNPGRRRRAVEPHRRRPRLGRGALRRCRLGRLRPHAAPGSSAPDASAQNRSRCHASRCCSPCAARAAGGAAAGGDRRPRRRPP